MANPFDAMERHRPVQAPSLEFQHDGYQYREYLPSPRLASRIACYWTVEIGAQGSSQIHRILPDGCIDIILNRSATSCRSAAFVAGLMTEYEVMPCTDPGITFGIRLFAGTAQTFLRYPLSHFQGAPVYLEEIWGAEALLLTEKLLSALSVEAMICILEEWAVSALYREEWTPHVQSSLTNWVQHGILAMYDRKGCLSMGDLSDELGFTERHVRRAFQGALGIGPKTLAEIIRFQCLLNEWGRSPSRPLADLAYPFGYYDQSHFIKSFKRLYGLSPGQFSSTGFRLRQTI